MKSLPKIAFVLTDKVDINALLKTVIDREIPSELIIFDRPNDDGDKSQLVTKLEKHRPDLIIWANDEFQAPFMDKVLCEQIRQNPNLTSAKILLLWIGSHDWGRHSERKLDADQYLRLPSPVEEMAKTIAEMLDKL